VSRVVHATGADTTGGPPAPALLSAGIIPARTLSSYETEVFAVLLGPIRRCAAHRGRKLRPPSGLVTRPPTRTGEASTASTCDSLADTHGQGGAGGPDDRGQTARRRSAPVRWPRRRASGQWVHDAADRGKLVFGAAEARDLVVGAEPADFSGRFLLHPRLIERGQAEGLIGAPGRPSSVQRAMKASIYAGRTVMKGG
jgi:hypothetical protein